MSRHHAAHWSASDSRKWRARIKAAWTGECWKCGRQLDIDGKWDVGHIIDVAEDGSNHAENIGGAECYPCNRGQGGRKGQAIQHAARQRNLKLPTGWGI